MTIFPAYPEDAIFTLIDVQEKLVRPMNMERYGKKFTQAIKLMNTLGVHTVVTEQYPAGLGETIPEIKALLTEKTSVYPKTAFSCWQEVAYAKHITARPEKTLIIGGMEAHVCVLETVLNALDRGYQVIVLADVVCSIDEYDKEVALDLMRSAGAVVTTLQSLVFHWVADAKAPEFKAVSKIVSGRD